MQMPDGLDNRNGRSTVWPKSRQ